MYYLISVMVVSTAIHFVVFNNEDFDKYSFPMRVFGELLIAVLWPLFLIGFLISLMLEKKND